MSNRFKTAKKPPVGEAVVRALISDYLVVQAEAKATEIRKKELSGAILEAMEEMGEDKVRFEDLGTASISISPRTTYSRQSVAEGLVAAKVPEKFHAALLDAAGKVAEVKMVVVRGVKEKDDN